MDDCRAFAESRDENSAVTGKWFDFPVDEDDVKEKVGPDFQWSDFDGDFTEFGKLSVTTDTGLLNKIAEFCQSHSDQDTAILAAIVDDGGYSKISDIIDNAVQKFNEILVVPSAGKGTFSEGEDKDLGESYVIATEGDLYENLSDEYLEGMRDELESHFDEQAYMDNYHNGGEMQEYETFEDTGMSVSDLSINEIAAYYDYEFLGRDLRISGFIFVSDADAFLDTTSY